MHKWQEHWLTPFFNSNYCVLWMSLYYVGCQHIVTVLCFFTSFSTLIISHLEISWLDLHIFFQPFSCLLNWKVYSFDSSDWSWQNVSCDDGCWCFVFCFSPSFTPQWAVMVLTLTSSSILTSSSCHQWCDFPLECQLDRGFSVRSQGTVGVTSTRMRMMRSQTARALALWLGNKWHKLSESQFLLL